MNTNVKHFGYDRKSVKPGILHFGVGNFHRAHQEAYTDALMSIDAGQYGWGIAGAMLLPSDERLYRALKEQNGEYTLTICGRDGYEETRVIGSLTDVVWAQEDPESIINL